MRILLLLVLSFSLTCYASDAIQLDDVEVHASAQQSLQTAGYQFFSREEIEGKFGQLSEFLATVNGLQIQQLSGLGNPALVSIRGASTQQTRILINGIESSEAQFGGYDLNALSINQIESIEIVHNGDNRAIGGTIRITTRKSKESQLTLQTGSYGTYIGNATIPLAKLGSLQLEHQQSDNNYSYPVPSPAWDSQNQFKKEPLNNAEFKKNSIQMAVGKEQLAARIRLAKQQKNVENFTRNHPENTAYLAENSGVIEVNGLLNAFNMQQQWLTGYSQRQEQFVDHLGYVGLGVDDNHYQYKKGYVQFENQAYWGNWQHRIDAKYSEESFDSEYKLATGNCNGITVCDTESKQILSTYGTSLQWESDKRNHLFNVDIYQQNIRDESQPKHGNRIPTSQQEYFTGINIGYQWSLSNSEWEIHWKKAARIPTLYERYGNHGLMLNNVNLKTEISENLSLDYSLRMYNNISLSASIFHRKLDNAIVPIYDSRGIGRYENTSSAELIGAEWNIQYSLRSWYLKVSSSHYDSITKSEIKSFDSKKLAGTYHQSIKVFSGYSIDSHFIEISYEWNDDLYIDRSNLVAGDTRWLINLLYKYTFKNSDIGLNVRNITDNQFNDFTNRPTIGREWLLFLNTRF